MCVGSADEYCIAWDAAFLGDDFFCGRGNFGRDTDEVIGNKSHPPTLEFKHHGFRIQVAPDGFGDSYAPIAAKVTAHFRCYLLLCCSDTKVIGEHKRWQDSQRKNSAYKSQPTRAHSSHDKSPFSRLPHPSYRYLYNPRDSYASPG
jgi:hypothetical protein